MTYRIAHVRFRRDDRTYPVNCPRADLLPNDRVIVEMPQQAKLKRAVVDHVENLNWPCANTIICKEDEFRPRGDGTWHIERPEKPTIETIDDLADHVRSRGWQSYWPTSKVWRRIYAGLFPHGAGIIALRANGIDFQFVPKERSLAVSGNKLKISTLDGRFVRHNYFQSSADILQLASQFASEAERPEAELDRFFVPVGTTPSKVARRPGGREADDLAQIRNAINGGAGGSAYLCDDVWI